MVTIRADEMEYSRAYPAILYRVEANDRLLVFREGEEATRNSVLKEQFPISLEVALFGGYAPAVSVEARRTKVGVEVRAARHDWTEFMRVK